MAKRGRPKKVTEETTEMESTETAKESKSKRSKGTRNVYGNYQNVRLLCRTTSPWLGSQQDAINEKYDRVFIRDDSGNIIVPSGNILAMIRESLQRHGQAMNAFTKIFPVSAVIIPNGTKMTGTTKPLLTNGKGSGGAGKTTFETLPPGHDFVLDIDVPGTVWDEESFRKLIEQAGKRVGLYAYRKGDYGLFDIVGEVPCQI